MLPKPIAPNASMQRPFLSSPAARPMRFGNAQAGDRHPIDDPRLRDQHFERRALDPRERRQGQVVRMLRIEAEQEWARQRIGNERT